MKKIKPVLGFIKELVNGVPTDGEYVSWVGYIDGEDVWIASYDEESMYDDETKVFDESTKKIISKNHIDISGHIHLAKEDYKISQMGLERLQQTPDSLVDNINFWPNLSIDELKSMREKSGTILYNEYWGRRFEFKPY